MKPTCTILITLFLIACGNASIKQTATTQNTNQVVAANANGEGKFEVKAIRNGAEIANYKAVSARPIALVDDNYLMLMLSSPDNKHHLTIEMPMAKPGTYPFVDQNGGPKVGQARMGLQTESAPLVLNAMQGALKLDAINEKNCSGTFKGTGTDLQGATFTIEGSFTNMPVKTV